MNDAFRKFAYWVAETMGTPWAFSFAVLAVVLCAAPQHGAAQTERPQADKTLSPFFFDCLHLDGDDLIDRLKGIVVGNPAHEGVRLQPRADGRVRGSAWLGRVMIQHV